MTDDLKTCTVRWQFLKSLEPPRVVHARCTDLITKDNIFGQVYSMASFNFNFNLSNGLYFLFQVTVRFHTQQTLAVYDRFGRLVFGNEVVAKDVLEYVVFEKHVANIYGLWRIHEKIIPDWMPERDAGKKTYIKQKPVEAEPVADSATDKSAAVA